MASEIIAGPNRGKRIINKQLESIYSSNAAADFELTLNQNCPKLSSLRFRFGFLGNARHLHYRALRFVFLASVFGPENHIDRQSFRFILHFVGKGRSTWLPSRKSKLGSKPEPIGPVVPTITEFEQVVREYKLTPDQYLRSTRLREWARRNKNSKYIPEPLLEAWGFEIESTL